METLLHRLCLLLAGSDFSANQLRKLLSDVKEVDLTMLEVQIRRLRDFDGYGLPFDEPTPDRTRFKSEKTHADAALKIDSLLRQEARLPTREAMELLTVALLKRSAIRRSEIPPLGRKSFIDWVERLLRIVPASEAVHLATIIRNQRVHARPTDWPLEKR